MNVWEVAILKTINSLGGEAGVQQIFEKVADFKQLTREHLRKTRWSREKPAYQYQVRHCITKLYHDSKLIRVSKGRYSLTEKGLKRILEQKNDLKKGGEMSTGWAKIKRVRALTLLRDEKEELEERIDRLQGETEEVDNKIERLEIEEIIDGLKCPKDFLCYKTKYEKLCKAGYNTKTETMILRCLEENSQGCKFSLLYKDKYYCQCPLRNYIAKKLGK